MTLSTRIKNQLAPLTISNSKKETINALVKNYELSEAKTVLLSCVSKEPSNQNTVLMELIAEIEAHISLFNDDLESDEIIYNSL